MSNNSKSQALLRIESLFDANSFVEIGSLVTSRSTDFNMAEIDTPSDGVVTGYGTIGGVLAYAYSQDPAVLSGSIGEMHARKICNIYDMAVSMGAPIIGLVDCAGLRLQESTDALNAFGNIYLKQTAAAGVIPQITAIFGNCGGGLAAFTALTDFTFMESSKAQLFVNSPNALSGNKDEKISSAKYMSENVGIVDFTGSESEIFEGIRKLLEYIPSNSEDENLCECADDLNRASAIAGEKDVKKVISELSDEKKFLEVKSAFAKDIVTGFIKLNGATVGVVANGSEYMSADGCDKAAEFINFCDSFGISILSLTNTVGYDATIENEKRIAKSSAALTYAFASSTVPKVNFVLGKAFGCAGVTMNSKSIGADMVFALPDAAIGMMDAGKAAAIMFADKPELIPTETDKYDMLQNSVISAAKHGYVDRIVENNDARKYIISAFEMLYSKRSF